MNTKNLNRCSRMSQAERAVHRLTVGAVASGIARRGRQHVHHPIVVPFTGGVGEG